MSHPHPLSLPPKKLLLLPPQQNSKRIIQMKLHPHPLLLETLPHPHPVAVKSLIMLPPKGFIYDLSYVAGLVCVSIKKQKYGEFFKNTDCSENT